MSNITGNALHVYFFFFFFFSFYFYFQGSRPTYVRYIYPPVYISITRTRFQFDLLFLYTAARKSLLLPVPFATKFPR